MLKGYILRFVSQMFFPSFFILLFISMIILLISIATITTSIKMTMSDLLTLLYYGMPGSLFFVVSITFFSSCVLGLSKLSYDSEMLVFFSLGVSPKRIVLIFLPLCLLASCVLLMFSFVMTPLSKNAYRDFLSYKLNTVDINLKPGDFGQKLGDWLVYIDSKNNNTFRGLTLYSSSLASKDSFIVANEGKAVNKNGIFELDLFDGDAYFSENQTFQKVHFKNLKIQNKIQTPSTNTYNLLEYWGKIFKGDTSQQKRFSQSLVTSLFPIASIFFIPFFGIKNPRFQKNHSYSLVLGSVLFYFLIMYGMSMEMPFVGLALPFAWFFAGFYLYKKYISKLY